VRRDLGEGDARLVHDLVERRGATRRQQTFGVVRAGLLAMAPAASLKEFMML
jgi:hypothetical protein